jgi:hypothetical protein
MSVNANEMDALVGRTERLVSSIAGAILASTEAAAERIELAARVAQVNQRMVSFATVLESVAAQRQALAERLETAQGPLRSLLEAQLAALAAQELAILERAGVPSTGARLAGNGDGLTQEQAAIPATHRRDGRRFVRVEGDGTSNNGNE